MNLKQQTDRKLTYIPRDVSEDARLEGLSRVDRILLSELWSLAEDDGRGWVSDVMQIHREEDLPAVRALVEDFGRRGVIEILDDAGATRYRVVGWRQPTEEEIDAHWSGEEDGPMATGV